MRCDWKFKLDCVLNYKKRKLDFMHAGICRRGFLVHATTRAEPVVYFGGKGIKYSPKIKNGQ